jgi:ubiquitin C-terminal hydrolase
MALENIVTAAERMDARSAETHRLSAISNIENALHSGSYDDDQQKRLKRLLKILNDSANDNNDRKLAVLQVTIFPVLEHLGVLKGA